MHLRLSLTLLVAPVCHRSGNEDHEESDGDTNASTSAWGDAHGVWQNFSRRKTLKESGHWNSLGFVLGAVAVETNVILSRIAEGFEKSF